MADLFPVAGMRFFIGGTMSTQSTDFVEADFAAQSWTEVDGWSQMGASGDTAALISTDLINRGRTTKQKGTANAGSMQNVFAIVPNDPGQIAFIAAAQAANKANYAFKLQGNDAAAAATVLTGVSATAASPGVITKTAHGLVVGQAIKFTAGSGTLPTGIVDGTTYYVQSVLSSSTFQISATKGGSAINTSGSPSGTYTVTTIPTPSLRYFVGLAMSSQEAGGAANTVQNMTGTIEINSNIVKVAAAA